MSDPERWFPRLAVISEVSVLRTWGGSLLFYRLFERYPPEQLVAVDVGNDQFRDRRLPDVRYLTIPDVNLPSILAKHYNPVWPLILPYYRARHVDLLLRQIEPLRVEGIVTVTAHRQWIFAAMAAKRLGVPLYLFLHDDWATYQSVRRTGPFAAGVRWSCRQLMARVYRQAAARFCVSEGMHERCEQWFGRKGVVLYPSRGADSPSPKNRLREDRSGPPIVAFCGHIHQDGALALLVRLANLLHEMGGHLDLYTPHSQERLVEWGLSPPVVRRIGFFPPLEMAERLGATADILFLPASFEPREAVDVATLFPSKLTDYTAIGLPILIWGSAESSAVRWAKRNDGVAEVITTPDIEEVQSAVLRIIDDPVRSSRMVSNAIDVGNRDFDPATIRRIFFDRIRPFHTEFRERPISE